MNNSSIEYVAKLREQLMTGGAAAIEAFTMSLKTNNAVAEEFAKHCENILIHSHHVEFLVDTGIPENRGILSTAFSRIIRKFIPAPINPRSIKDSAAAIFPNFQSAQWLSQLPVSFIDASIFTIEEFSNSKSKVWAPLENALLAGLEVTASRAFTMSCNPEIVSYLDESSYKRSVFYKLKIAIQELVYFSESKKTEALNSQFNECEKLIETAKIDLNSVIARMEERGVSVEVVYLVDLIARALDRILMFLQILSKAQDNQARYIAFIFTAGLVTDSLKSKQLRELFSGNLVLLTRKITEHASRTGEHYITVTRGEYTTHFVKSLGAGLITAVTTLCKFLITKARFAPLFETSLMMFNYVSSFLFLQVVGWTLATKQPSMTAASLADAIGRNDSGQLGTLVARIFRSQFISVLGNVLAVIPAAIAIDLAYYSFSGTHVLTYEKAVIVAQSVDVLAPSTYILATLTGCLLWLSSIFGGWLENWVIYSRVADALRAKRNSKFFSKKFLNRLADIVDNHTLGFGSNTSLGILLALPALLGRAIGVSMDVKHVTLGTGSLAIASIPLIMSHDPIVPHLLFRGVLGLIAIGILNVCVSFALAFFVALRSRNVNQKGSVRAIKWILMRFLKRPIDFIIPPRGAKVEAPK